MKRIITIIGTLVAFALLAGSAQADRYSNPTCGQNNPAGNGVVADELVYIGPGQWAEHWSEHCGVGGTVSVEIQYSQNRGPWTDDTGSDTQAYTVVNGGVWEHRTHVFSSDSLICFPTTYRYRMHVWADQNANFPDDAVQVDLNEC